MSTTISTAAERLWAAIEAVEALTDEDLRSPGVASIAEHAWELADTLEARIEAATGQVAA